MKAGTRKILIISAWVFATVILLFISGEITLRLLGWKPWVSENKTTSVIPGGSLFQPDEALGYRCRPGKFNVTLGDTLKFSATHDKEGHRVNQEENDSVPKPEIWIFGCSFTYGWGVNDSETWPAQWAQYFPGYTIKNFSAPAYGTVHSWLQLKQELQKGKKPEYVILAFGGFHIQRNVCDRLWKKALSGQPVMKDIRYPYAYFVDESVLKVDYSDLLYRPWPLMGTSAFIHFLEQKYDESEESNLSGFEITRELIFRMLDMTHEAGAHFILAGIWRDPSTTQMLDAVRGASGMKAIDISVGQSEGFTILPGDPHPNAVAHQKMAENLLELGKIPAR